VNKWRFSLFLQECVNELKFSLIVMTTSTIPHITFKKDIGWGTSSIEKLERIVTEGYEFITSERKIWLDGLLLRDVLADILVRLHLFTNSSVELVYAVLGNRITSILPVNTFTKRTSIFITRISNHSKQILKANS
jgi:hypothetical protein